MERHYNILVKGKVQGVFYRANLQAEAQKLGIRGNVRNMANGNVFIEAEGSEEDLDKLVEWCWHGPPRAVVTELEVTESENAHYSSFVVTR